MSAILIGPWCAGKTTVGAPLAHALGVPFIDLDQIAFDYGAELGWSIDLLLQRNQVVGMLASEREWEHVRVHAVRRVLEDHPASLIALGASYTDFVNIRHENAVHSALQNDPRPVVLVTPSLDDKATSQITRHRATHSRGPDWVHEREQFPSWSPSAMAHSVADIIHLTA